MSWLYHAKVTVIPIVKYEIKTFRAQRGVEKHKDIKIPRCSNKTSIASNFLDTVIILHTTAHIKFLDFLVQQPGNSAYKGRLRFKQYMKDKPTKWGIKAFVLSDARNG